MQLELAAVQRARPGMIASSWVSEGGLVAWLEHAPQKQLVVVGDAELEGEPIEVAGVPARRCPLSEGNAARLAARLAWLNPQPLGTRLSFGFGDRLGNATCGHIAALRRADPAGRMAPVFAQQSVRENRRTGRSPQAVLAAARWGVLEGGWRGLWGADADHLKTAAELAAFAEAGYTLYTIDPSECVDGAAQRDDAATLQAKLAALPWGLLEDSYPALRARYLRRHALAGLTLAPSELELARALVKYGRALAHALELARALRGQLASFELELSVDESDSPTTPFEHYLLASELRRRGLPLVSVAPRFVGKLQKGVDYIGDIAEFARALRPHCAIAAHFDYKLSVHSGSDKFRLYPIIAEQLGERVHLKTAGTSYLEALRVIARWEPALFRELLELARTAFEAERHSYALDCQPQRVPAGAQLRDDALPELLEQPDARQLLHVTFGAVIRRYRAPLLAALSAHQAAYTEALAQHLARHLAPFV